MSSSQVPLHGVDPVFQIEQMLQRTGRIGVVDRLMHVIGFVIFFDALAKNPVGFVGNFHG